MELLATTGQHAPELLFSGWPDAAGCGRMRPDTADVAERARISPVVAWKVQNLRRMLDR